MSSVAPPGGGSATNRRHRAVIPPSPSAAPTGAAIAVPTVTAAATVARAIRTRRELAHFVAIGAGTLAAADTPRRSHGCLYENGTSLKEPAWIVKCVDEARSKLKPGSVTGWKVSVNCWSSVIDEA